MKCLPLFDSVFLYTTNIRATLCIHLVDTTNCSVVLHKEFFFKNNPVLKAVLTYKDCNYIVFREPTVQLFAHNLDKFIIQPTHIIDIFNTDIAMSIYYPTDNPDFETISISYYSCNRVHTVYLTSISPFTIERAPITPIGKLFNFFLLLTLFKLKQLHMNNNIEILIVKIITKLH